jgi:acetyltransferase-like isoleucine patch superfamily enzyme
MKNLKFHILTFLNYLKHRAYSKKKDQISIDTSSRLLRGFNIKFLVSPEKRKYVEIGKNCMLNNSILFESSTGKVNIGDRCYFGSDGIIISRKEVIIGNDVTFAWGVTIYDHNSHSLAIQDRKEAVKHFYLNYGKDDCFEKIDFKNVKAGSITIKDNVWVGMDVLILKGVTIGEGAVIAARSVVFEDVEPYSIYAGNPARLVKKINNRT